MANITSDKLANGYEVKKVMDTWSRGDFSEDISNQIDHVQAVLEGDSNLRRLWWNGPSKQFRPMEQS